MKIKMFNENNEIEIVEIGSERHKQLNFIADNAIKEIEKIEIRALKKENKQLKEQLAIREKALELACERIKNMYEQEQQYCTNEIENFVKVEYDFFIERAKESLKNGK